MFSFGTKRLSHEIVLPENIQENQYTFALSSMDEVHSWSNVPFYYTFDEADLNLDLLKKGLQLTLDVFPMYAARLDNNHLTSKQAKALTRYLRILQ